MNGADLPITERVVLDAQSVDFPLGEKPMDSGDEV
jgi:hypothetical protein